MAGLIIAFQKFIPSKGMFGDQQWVGLGNFTYVFSLPGFDQALKKYNSHRVLEDRSGTDCAYRFCIDAERSEPERL